MAVPLGSTFPAPPLGDIFRLGPVPVLTHRRQATW